MHQQSVTNFQRGEAYEYLTAIVLNANGTAVQNNPQFNDYDQLTNQLVRLGFLTIPEPGQEAITMLGAHFLSTVVGDLFINYQENLRVGVLEGEPLHEGQFVDVLQDFLKVGSNVTDEGPIPINFFLEVMYLTSVGLNKFDIHYQTAKGDEIVAGKTN